jgi:hypothetical protein
MKLPEDITSLSRQELLALVVRLQEKIADLTATIEGLRGEC